MNNAHKYARNQKVDCSIYLDLYGKWMAGSLQACESSEVLGLYFGYLYAWPDDSPTDNSPADDSPADNSPKMVPQRLG